MYYYATCILDDVCNTQLHIEHLFTHLYPYCVCVYLFSELSQPPEHFS